MDVPAPMIQADPAFDRDKFLLCQKRIAINEKYYVRDENDQSILFVERPTRVLRTLAAFGGAIVIFFLVVFAALMASIALDLQNQKNSNEILMIAAFSLAAVGALAAAIYLYPKRHVTFYRGEDRDERLLEVLQDSKWQIPTATYTVLDAEGKPLARLYKNYLHNILRKKWRCTTLDGDPICVAMEDSVILSLLRRVLGPFFGLLRTNFVLFDGDGRDELLLGEFNRKFTIFDRYALDLTADSTRKLDRRLAVAVGVMLDTGEHR
jgi:hypothetical protein